MVEQLLNHIANHNLCKTTDKILLAVSGGVDSMVMLHLFRKAGFKTGVAHCNFQLRAEASEGDESFVSKICAGYKIPFHSRRFDTIDHTTTTGLSVQMAARELRYRYFDELLEKHDYQYVATAHHLNDSLETVILNFIKGSGIEGLAGIPVKNEKIIRPMLFATKAMLYEYADAHRLQWRDDASNSSDDYQRNFIRHQIIPLMKEINPGLEQTFINTRERLAGAKQLTKLFLDHFRQQALHFSRDQVTIDRKELMETLAPAVLLWELLKEKGFNIEQCREIVSGHQAGKIFFSRTHMLTTAREQYIIQEITRPPIAPVTISRSLPVAQNLHGTLYFSEQKAEGFKVMHDAELAQLDLDKITYPLLWRHWMPGDTFVPLGMHHSKKISDFLIDIKVSLPEKEKVTVIESAGTIIWIVGYRIHNDFKITDGTKQVLTIRYQPK